MIVQWFVGIIATVVHWSIGALPTTTLPDWTSTVSSLVTTINSYITGVAVWLPFSALSTVVVLIATVIGVALLVKVARIVLSFFTAGGGSAG
jgi:hypothetical protein